MKHHTLAGYVATTLATAATVVLPAANAHAASCYGSSCLGKDPQTEGCSADATTLAQASDPGGTLVIQVRYSSACSAYRARSLVCLPSEPN